MVYHYLGCYMLKSFSEFKFYQSFRIPVEAQDDLRFMVEMEDELGNSKYIEDAKLIDVSVTGLGFATQERISVDRELTISLQFKKLHLDLTGRVVRAFSESFEDQSIIYGVEIDDEPKVFNFLEKYILSFSSERLKDCLTDSALKERYTKASDGFEIFSLLLSLFKDINNFGDKEGFIDSMLEEVLRLLNAQRASIFLINPDTNELEAIAAIGVDKDKLKFDYRKGVADSVFTTGIALNIDATQNKARVNEEFDKTYGLDTRSIICYPIHNRHDKIIGVIEVINKRNQDIFTIEDEKSMKVLTLVFSSVFHTFNPMSETSAIRRFSKPFDRKLALIGKTPQVRALRRSFPKLKDLDSTVLIAGEPGVGKTLYAQILHAEGQRGVHAFEEFDCSIKDGERVSQDLLIPGVDNKLMQCQGGTVVLKHVEKLSMEHQLSLKEILRLGGFVGSSITLDARIMATASEDIGQLVDSGDFDRELFQLLSESVVNIEPLRRRKEDLSELISYFFKIECGRKGILYKSFSDGVMKKLMAYDWPANIAEVKKLVERAVLYNPKEHLISELDLDDATTPLVDFSMKRKIFGDNPLVYDSQLPLKDRLAIVERELILAEIKRCNGNKSKAAKEMGMSREALRKKMLLSDQVIEEIENQRANKKAA